MPKISVIMGVYNCYDEKNALIRSIDSILNQTYIDIEFIICDDGSIDETYNFIKETYGDNERVILIRNTANKGLAFTLNHCLAFVKGDYIARQDADDYSDLTRFEKEYNFLEKHKEYDFVSSKIRFFDGDNLGNEIPKIEKPKKEDFLIGSPFVHPATMFRKGSLIQVNGYRELKITRRCEDYDLFMRMYAEGMRGYNIQEVLHYFKFSEREYLRRRKYKYYLEETLVRMQGFYRMKILISLKGITWMLKPAIVGLVPSKLIYRRYKIGY